MNCQLIESTSTTMEVFQTYSLPLSSFTFPQLLVSSSSSSKTFSNKPLSSHLLNCGIVINNIVLYFTSFIFYLCSCFFMIIDLSTYVFPSAPFRVPLVFQARACKINMLFYVLFYWILDIGFFILISGLMDSRQRWIKGNGLLSKYSHGEKYRLSGYHILHCMKS